MFFLSKKNFTPSSLLAWSLAEKSNFNRTCEATGEKMSLPSSFWFCCHFSFFSFFSTFRILCRETCLLIIIEHGCSVQLCKVKLWRQCVFQFQQPDGTAFDKSQLWAFEQTGESNTQVIILRKQRTINAFRIFFLLPNYVNKQISHR